MDSTLETTTLVGLGHATLADAFQCGREAAQMAKSQIPDGKLDLVLVFGPGNVHFKDFIEGVRLVTGEDTLIGVPVSQIYSPERTNNDPCYVIVFQTSSMRFSIGHDNIRSTALLKGTTTLVSEFRRARGNDFRNFATRGVLLFENCAHENMAELAHDLSSDIGLNKWIVGLAPFSDLATPFVCRNMALRSGMIGVECLSHQPWGLGTVDVGSFPDQAAMVREGVKAAVRDALAQLKGHPPALGLVFIEKTPATKDTTFSSLLEGAASLMPNKPLLGIPTKRHFSRRMNRSVQIDGQSVVVLLVPA